MCSLFFGVKSFNYEGKYLYIGASVNAINDSTWQISELDIRGYALNQQQCIYVIPDIISYPLLPYHYYY